MAKIKGDKRYSIITDHLGTPLAMFDEAGAKTWSADTDIYGALINVAGNRSDCPFRFPGQYEDEETGLYYNRFRYYDAEMGGYVSQDPIGLAGGSNNLYRFVTNPFTGFDLLGLSATNSVYVLKDADGTINYIGITERDPAIRMQEHANSGKSFHHMEVIDDGLTRRQAIDIEGSALRHRKGTGLQNKTRLDGGYYHSYSDNPASPRHLFSADEIDNKLNNGKYSIKKTCG